MAGDIRNTKRFRELAAFLRERAGRDGVKLVAGEAEKMLAERVTAIATQLGVTPRTALGYVSEDNLEVLARELGSLAEEYDDAAQTAEPVIIKIMDAGRMVAALGMAVKLAAEHIEDHQADAAGIATDRECSYSSLKHPMTGKVKPGVFRKATCVGGPAARAAAAGLGEPDPLSRYGSLWCTSCPSSRAATCRSRAMTLFPALTGTTVSSALEDLT